MTFTLALHAKQMWIVLVKSFLELRLLGIFEKNFSQQNVLVAQNELGGGTFRSFSGQNISSLIVATGPKKIQKILFIGFIDFI